LHRAGVIFNYDIPFNPTRVIQRIGRINRINKKVFDALYVYNFFPTSIGEAETRIQQIARSK
jgi:superfamily II DNA/RNA helicase